MPRILAAVTCLLSTVPLCATEVGMPTALVYTRNGPTLDGKKGFVHDNIPSCVAALKKLAQEGGYRVEVSDDPAVFSPASLKNYRAIIFANSNNAAFDNEEQRAAFQTFIHGGGGFVGIHSASGSERGWPWFWQLLGGTFDFHAPMQKFAVTVADAKHPATAFFGRGPWEWEDEFYVMKNQPSGLRVLLAGNIKPLKMPEEMRKKVETLPDSVPLAWCQEFEGGRSFYTSLGHKKSCYEDKFFLSHLQGGIRWAMRLAKTPTPPTDTSKP